MDARTPKIMMYCVADFKKRVIYECKHTSEAIHLCAWN